MAKFDAQYQVDLTDLQGIARQNGGIKYILTVNYVFSKFAWTVPIQSTIANTTTAAFVNVLTSANPRHHQRLQTDKGNKFFNSDFQALMKRHVIRQFATEGEKKATVVKRFNRNVETKI